MVKISKPEIEKTLDGYGLWGSILAVFMGFSIFMVKAFDELELYKAICVILFVTFGFFNLSRLHKLFYYHNKINVALFLIICGIPSMPSIFGYSTEEQNIIAVLFYLIALIPWLIFHIYNISKLKSYLKS